jgi:hypothetical protein
MTSRFWQPKSQQHCLARGSGAMDDIPLLNVFSRSGLGAQALAAYYCSRRHMFVSSISDEDFTKISAALLWQQQCSHGISGMDDILFFCPAGAQGWQAYHYFKLSISRLYIANCHQKPVSTLIVF